MNFLKSNVTRVCFRRQDFQRTKRDADVSKRLLSDVRMQLKNMKSEQEQAQGKVEEQKKEAVEAKSQVDRERKAATKFKEDHDKMKEKFDEYRRGEVVILRWGSQGTKFCLTKFQVLKDL